MVILITLLAFITTLIVVYFLLASYTAAATAVDVRLKALEQLTAGRSDIEQELAQPFAQRILSPLTGSFARNLTRYTPQALQRIVAAKLELAGGFGGLNVDSFVLLDGMLAITLAGIMYLISLMVPAIATKLWLVMGAAVIGGMLLPFLLLDKKIAQRKRSIQKALPDVLDLLTVSVEAGLGFDGALAKLSEKMRGALVDEFTRLLQEIRIGVSRREALHALARRCDVPDLAMFVTSLVQADQLGVSIGNVLRVQSAAMRSKRRQRAQEKAMKAPVKMLLPLVLFIFPPIFIVLLGPALIQVITNLGQR
jgi:tight adherence protein C